MPELNRRATRWLPTIALVAIVVSVRPVCAGIVLQGADLSIKKIDSPDPVTVGEHLTYTLTVANAGPSAATTVSITDMLPPGATVVSAEATQGMCIVLAGDPEGTFFQVGCVVDALNPRESVAVTIVVVPAIAGLATNTASVKATGFDPNSENNTASETTTVTRITPLVTHSPTPTPSSTSTRHPTPTHTQTRLPTLAPSATPTRTSISTQTATRAPTPTATPPPRRRSIIVVKLNESSFAPLPGWTMTLFPGAACAGSPLDQKVTDARGLVDFIELPAGVYSVREQPQPGYTNVTPQCQSIAFTDEEPTPVPEGAGLRFPPPGVDTFESGGTVFLELTGLGNFPVTLNGPTTIQRGAPGDRDEDGRTDIDTEIVSMHLTGTGPGGLVLVTQSPKQRSRGLIEQQAAGEDFPADSFFDVFVDIATPIGTLHNRDPIHMQATITAIPPTLNLYRPPAAGSIALYDANENRVGFIRHAMHLPLPPNERIIVFINRPPPKRSIIVIKLNEFDFRPLPGFPMTLFAGPSCSGAALAREVTDARGLVDFTDLDPGTYSVLEEQQPAYEAAGPPCQSVDLVEDASLADASERLVYPPAGDDEFASGASVILELIGLSPAYVTLNGPVRIHRNDPGDRDADGRIDIDTEIVQMELTGTGPLGPVTVTQSATRRSRGAIEQQTAGKDFPADSFFDVFVEIQTSTLMLHNRDPIRMQSVITTIPPTLSFYRPPAAGSIPLYDPAGTLVGFIRHAIHVPLPPREKVIVIINRKPPPSELTLVVPVKWCIVDGAVPVPPAGAGVPQPAAGRYGILNRLDGLGHKNLIWAPAGIIYVQQGLPVFVPDTVLPPSGVRGDVATVAELEDIKRRCDRAIGPDAREKIVEILARTFAGGLAGVTGYSNLGPCSRRSALWNKIMTRDPNAYRYFDYGHATDGHVWPHHYPAATHSAFTRSLSHEDGHALCLTHPVDGVDDDGDGLVDEDDPDGIDDDGDGTDGEDPSQPAGRLMSQTWRTEGLGLTAAEIRAAREEAQKLSGTKHKDRRGGRLPVRGPRTREVVDEIGEVSQPWLDLGDVIAVRRADGALGLEMDLAGLLPNTIAPARYLFMVDVDNNPNTGGSPDVGFAHSFEGADLLVDISVTTARGERTAAATVQRFEQGQFVPVVDGRIEAEIITISGAFDTEDPRLRLDEMPVFDSVKFLLPGDLLPLPLAEGYRVAAAAFDPATATLDEAPILIGSVTEFPEPSQIALSPSSGGPGTLLSVAGVGFTASSQVDIFVGAQTTPAATTITDLSGAFAATFVVPDPVAETASRDNEGKVVSIVTAVDAAFVSDAAMFEFTALRCVGDCNADGEVTVDEIITMVNIALGIAPVSECPAGDADGGGDITVNEIILAVNNALDGCPR